MSMQRSRVPKFIWQATILVIGAHGAGLFADVPKPTSERPAEGMVQQHQSQIQQLLALAEQGYADAQYHVGMAYNNGAFGVKQDPIQAMQWFERAALGGDPLGAYKLGCYYAGQFAGTGVVDKTKAFELKLIAAKAGYVLAQHDVAIMLHQRGEFVQAGHWWRLAADQGFAASAYNLSTYFLKGEGGAVNRILGYAYFKLSQLLHRGVLTPTAQEALQTLSQQMSADDVAAAERQVSAWRPNSSPVSVRARSAAVDISRVLQGQSWQVRE